MFEQEHINFYIYIFIVLGVWLGIFLGLGLLFRTPKSKNEEKHV